MNERRNRAVDPARLDRLSPDVWQRVSKLFDEVLDLPETERIPFIRTLWGTEPDVARELMSMLVAAAEVQKSNAVTHEPFNAMLAEALAGNASSYASGARFGAWTLDVCLGKGGMGEVWKAHRTDGLYQASAAIKFLRTDATNQKALVARFARERSVLARLNHPNIARLLDAGIRDGTAYLVLELVDGRPLLDHLCEAKPSLAERVAIVRQIALAVEHAHNQMVLHRDLKPSNVLISRDGTIKLLDFGVAAFIQRPDEEPHTKLTQLTGRALTLEYASPEHIAGEMTTPASDVYSLGVLLFHLCTGSRPFAEHTSRAALEYALMNREPPIASRSIVRGPKAEVIADHVPPPNDADRLAGELDLIIQRAMQLSPEKRYPTAAALAADLGAWLEGRPTSHRAHDRLYQLRLWLRRHAALTATAAATAAVMIGASIWAGSVLVSQQRALQAERDAAQALAAALGELRSQSDKSGSTSHAAAIEAARRSLPQESQARRRFDQLTR